jgi:chemotaxis protein CheD
MTEHRVGIARHAVEREPGRLVAVGLGSCVVICLHDAKAQVGALAHVLLPEATPGTEPDHPARYANTAVPLLIKTMKLHGANGPYTARLVGGAALFADVLTTVGRVGERNVNAARAALADAGITIIAEDVGGTMGRSVAFDVGSGSIAIRLPSGEAHVL